MAKFKGKIWNGLVRCDVSFSFEIDDEELEYLSEDDIDEIALETVLQEIDFSYEQVEE